MNPLISLIIPMFNASKTIIKTLESIDQACLKANVLVQVMVVNDGSHDDGPMLVQNYVAKSAMSLSLINKSNGGISSARNVGLDHALGDWIMFCDADDLLDPFVITHHLAYLLRLDYEVIKFSVNFRNSPRFIHQDEDINHESLSKNYIKYRHEGVLTYVWSTFIYHDIIKKHHLRFDERIKVGAEDNAFMMDLMTHSTQWRLSSFLGIEYVQTLNSMMNSFKPHRYHAIHLMFEHEVALMHHINVSDRVLSHRVWWFCKAIFKEIYHSNQSLTPALKQELLIDVIDYHGLTWDMVSYDVKKTILRKPWNFVKLYPLLKILHLRRAS